MLTENVFQDGCILSERALSKCRLFYQLCSLAKDLNKVSVVYVIQGILSGFSPPLPLLVCYVTIFDFVAYKAFFLLLLLFCNCFHCCQGTNLKHKFLSDTCRAWKASKNVNLWHFLIPDLTIYEEFSLTKKSSKTHNKKELLLVLNTSR